MPRAYANGWTTGYRGWRRPSSTRRPSAPLDFDVDRLPPDANGLSWSPPADPGVPPSPLTYTVSGHGGGGDWSILADEITGTSWTHDNPPGNDQLWVYRVAAVNPAGRSPWSPIDSPDAVEAA